MKHIEQLNQQIKETLSLIMPASLNLEVIDAISNGSSHIIIILEPSIEDFDYEAGYEALEEAKNGLLDEVVDSINRRRLPDITFKISKAINFKPEE